MYSHGQLFQRHARAGRADRRVALFSAFILLPVTPAVFAQTVAPVTAPYESKASDVNSDYTAAHLLRQPQYASA